MILDLVVPYRVQSSFHYQIDPELGRSLTKGSIVEVSLGTKKTHAYVVGFLSETTVPQQKLKFVQQVLQAESYFSEPMLRLLHWISEYYSHPLGEVFDAALPRMSFQKKNSKPRKTSRLSVDFNLGEEKSSHSVLPPHLTDEQKDALRDILDPSEKRPYLLHGVTGSGKTEVYLRVVESALREKKGAILLVPEISLTPQLMARFNQRFPSQIAVLHSDLTPSERLRQWKRVWSGEASVVVGARSAVFAPVKNLGVIVVDEEHETSFKQEDSLRYHARDVAIVRAQFEGAKIILGSATPSLESYSNATSGKYCYIEMKKRVFSQNFPKTTFVDMKDKNQWLDKNTPWLSKDLVQRIRDTLEKNNQIILYLNRLGFAHFLFCQDCGHTYRCSHCDVSLTYYQSPALLKCHYCDYQQKVPQQCQDCQGTELGFLGLGTEQVEKEIKKLFPEARIARMDRSQIKNRKNLEELLISVSKKEVDILIGTQMVAKGHDFPGISLVGILMADASLNLPDFRANERTFQIVTQVSGRAGRAQEPGEVVIQTLNPAEPALKWAAELKQKDFYIQELNARKLFGFPPFQRMAMLRFQHPDPKKVQKYADESALFLRRVVEKNKLECQILGPSEAPIARVKKQYRYQCLVKARSVRQLQALLQTLQSKKAQDKSPVKLSIDVDPMSSL